MKRPKNRKQVMYECDDVIRKMNEHRKPRILIIKQNNTDLLTLLQEVKREGM
jgi:hypothetical protein